MPEHSELTGDELHEVKGADTATDGQVLVANGDGTATFSEISYNDLEDLPSPTGYELLIYGTSLATSQEPATTDVALQIEFGAAQTSDDITLGADGTITAVTDGDYLFNFFFRFGRSGSSGTSILLNRFLFNDATTRGSNSASISSADEIIPFSTTIPIAMTAGDTLKMEILRDSAGNNSGGLLQTVSTPADWADTSTASVFIYKYVGLS